MPSDEGGQTGQARGGLCAAVPAGRLQAVIRSTGDLATCQPRPCRPRGRSVHVAAGRGGRPLADCAGRRDGYRLRPRVDRCAAAGVDGAMWLVSRLAEENEGLRRVAEEAAKRLGLG